MRKIFTSGCMIASLCLAGCEAQPVPPTTASNTGPAMPTLPAATPTMPTLPTPPVVEAPPPMPPPVENEAVKAGVGVGIKGRSLDEYNDGVESIIATPAIALFAAKERLAFEVQVPQAVLLFDAMEGRPPKSHDEFMEKVIKANNIVLPALPEGHTYRWDPTGGERGNGQLMVDRPKKAAPPVGPPGPAK